ncbi:MAG: HAMP domain-containing histidine kinase [Burkholderiales bacterium]|nr:HAMP domain-containing histidine kinase [Burkholderiales bacterium]
MDLIYSLLLFLGVTALILGSFVVKVVSQNDYVPALAQTLLVIAFLLIVVSWLWNPNARFGGLQQFLSSYFLSIGLPFETWMQSLANLADHEDDPEKFLAGAVDEMTRLPWVSGVRWHGPTSDGEVGEASKFSSQFSFRGVDFLIFTHSTLGPALTVHVKLLLRLLGDFYDAKRRELAQRNNAYTQAIYETGARLTHDVKNLLQSLRSLCAAAEGSDADQAEALRALMQRQLPQITQRLQGTLEKLKAPEKIDTALIDAARWWENLKQRYNNNTQIKFNLAGNPQGVSLPAELFDSIADNLVQNAMNKSRAQADFELTVGLSFDSGARLSVCDNGAPVNAAIARQLFGGPVPSRTGLGIGLYHAHQQAEQIQYRLSLQSNEPGNVCFTLSSLSPRSALFKVAVLPQPFD